MVWNEIFELSNNINNMVHNNKNNLEGINMKDQWNRYKITKGKKEWIIESILSLEEFKKSSLKGCKVEHCK